MNEATPKLPPETLSRSDRVRQGVTGHGVRFVLLFGLAGAITAFLALAFFPWG